ncbi:MAG: hypothetical protein HZB53_22280 [Chloroflexi bacterium]|nr:hypothetical protein [Chloroflexota bacterium]
MIFDTAEVRQLCEKHRGEEDFRVPKIVFLARSDSVAGEREYIERLAALVDEEKRIEWVNSLTAPDDGKHLGAWFEIMLFGLLQELGPVEVQPDIEGDSPDFRFSAGTQNVMLEARAVIRSATEKTHDIRTSEILSALRTIRRPFLVRVRGLVIGSGALEKEKFLGTVRDWLDNYPAQPIQFQDSGGNRVVLLADPMPELTQVVTVGPTTRGTVSGEVIRNPLKKKAGQHQNLRKAGHPYVVAILLESWQLTAEEVVEAWFGKQQTVINAETMQVIEQTFDRSGLHFFGSEIHHTSVSGTLVFRKEYAARLRRHTLRAWFVQNPFATVPIPLLSLPIVSSYVVTRRNSTGIWMGWVSAEPS